LRATVGSIRAARRAGADAASRATPMRTAAVAAASAGLVRTSCTTPAAERPQRAGEADAERDAGYAKPRGLTEDHPGDVALGGADRHPQADLGCALADSMKREPGSEHEPQRP
jgi:hypothetical protein